MRADAAKNALDAAVSQLVGRYCAAVHDKDVDAFLGLYAAGVRVFDTWGTWSYEGADAWRRAVEGWLLSLGDERVTVRFDDVEVIGAPDAVVAMSAVVTYAAVSSEGEQLRAMQNRLSWVLAATGDVLGIVHEHTSVPVSFDDLKAILRRDPAA
jgi:ketosteroid isomerase-like protein